MTQLHKLFTILLVATLALAALVSSGTAIAASSEPPAIIPLASGEQKVTAGDGLPYDDLAG